MSAAGSEGSAATFGKESSAEGSNYNEYVITTRSVRRARSLSLARYNPLHLPPRPALQDAAGEDSGGARGRGGVARM